MTDKQILDNFLAGKYPQIHCEKCEMTFLTNVYAFDENNQPAHHRGISTEPGVYFLGLPWLSRRGSSFIWGVWHDAKYIADQIVIQRQYQQYSN